MSEKFVIISHGRSGSTVLVNALNVNPKICCASELFGPNNQKHPDISIKTYKEGAADEFLKDFYGLNLKPVMGFKMFTFHARLNKEMMSAWDYLISEKAIKCIFLKRVDLLAAYISLQRAEKTGQWHPYFKENRQSIDKKLFIDSKLARKYILDVREQFDSARKNFSKHSCIEITYEELQYHIEDVIHKVSIFLEIEYVKSNLKFNSLVGKNYLDLVINKEEIISELNNILEENMLI